MSSTNFTLINIQQDFPVVCKTCCGEKCVYSAQVTFKEALDQAYYSFVGFAGDDTKEGSVTEVIAANAAAVGVPYIYFNGDHESSSYHSTVCKNLPLKLPCVRRNRHRCSQKKGKP